jgi:hypothetical protein
MAESGNLVVSATIMVEYGGSDEHGGLGIADGR